MLLRMHTKIDKFNRSIYFDCNQYDIELTSYDKISALDDFYFAIMREILCI